MARDSRLERGIGRLLLGGLIGYARLQSQLARRLDSAGRFAEGVALEALTAEERASISSRLYARAAVYGAAGLHPWEEEWYQRALPSPPARILLGGCGSGREVAALCDQGYCVFAAEPTPRLFHTAHERLKGRARVWPLSYEQWTARSNPPEVAALVSELLAQAPFDAVILGWGSLSHVLDDRAREQLFAKLAQLCPSGPWLLSFIAASDAWRPQNERARHWGRSLGRLLGSQRPAGVRAPNERFLPHAGFVRRLSQAEIMALAQSVQRSAEFGAPGAYPHCTLRLLGPPGG